jgi:hypothetical protein
MTAADCYLRRGTRIPQIYPGTLDAMVQAIKDAQRASSRVPGEHSLEVVCEGERMLIRVYENGALTWMYQSPLDV